MTRLVLIAALFASAAVPSAAGAQDYGRPALGAGRGDQAEAREGVRSGRQVPLSSVIERIARQTPGRLLNASMGDYGGRPAYFVQWQTNDGRVSVIVADAQSGAIIGRQ